MHDKSSTDIKYASFTEKDKKSNPPSHTWTNSNHDSWLETKNYLGMCWFEYSEAKANPDQSSKYK